MWEWRSKGKSPTDSSNPSGEISKPHRGVIGHGMNVALSGLGAMNVVDSQGAARGLSHVTPLRSVKRSGKIGNHKTSPSPTGEIIKPSGARENHAGNTVLAGLLLCFFDLST